MFDKFEVEENVVRSVKELGAKIVLLDSESKANRYADIVINAIVGAKERCDVKEVNNTRYYYGLKYIILRKEFHKYWRKKKEISRDIEKVLLIFGGSDPSNLTSKTLDAISKYDFKATLVLGPHFTFFDELGEVLRKCRGVSVLRDVNNVAELMYESDLVITSLGLTTFEAFCTGTPTIVICQNELQRKLYQHLSDVVRYLLLKFERTKLIELVDELSDRNTRKEISDYEKKVCDGKGVERVKQIILGLV